MYKLAISPSPQMSNSYTGVKTTEGLEMEKLAHICHAYHVKKGGECLTFTEKNDFWTGRPKKAKDFGASIYLVLHTNSGGGTGTVAFHAKNSPNSKKLSTLMEKRLTEYFVKNGIDSNRATPVKETLFYEARTAASLRMAHCYLEVNFHDNSKIAKFMVGHWDEIATIIVDAIWEFKGWKEIIPDYEDVIESTIGVHMRENPTSNSKSLQIVPKGGKAVMIGFENNWLKIKYDGKTGYSSRTYWDVPIETMEKFNPTPKPETEKPETGKQDPKNGPFVNSDGERLWFRTISGSHQTREAAEKELAKLKEQGFANPWVQAIYIKEK